MGPESRCPSGIGAQGISLTLGVILGLLAGYYGRWVDEFVMRLA
jgi:ABC-type dipeptide/oligopeptide/nickel transport system permease subunit